MTALDNARPEQFDTEPTELSPEEAASQRLLAQYGAGQVIVNAPWWYSPASNQEVAWYDRVDRRDDR